MKRFCVVFALLVLLVLSNAEETNKKKKKKKKPVVVSNRCTTSDLTYLYETCTCGKTEMTAVLNVKAREKNTEKPAVSVTAVLDISGSMKEEMKLMQDAAIFVLNSLVGLNEPHKFGTVTFESTAKDLTSLQLLTPTSAKTIDAAIRGTREAGSTNLFDGIKLGFEQQKQDSRNDPYVRVVFVLTDGKPNTGISQADAIVREVKKMVTERPDIVINSFALGTDIDYSLIRRIAEAGGGTSTLIEKESDIATAFAQALGGALSEVGDKIRYTFVPKPGITITHVMTSGTVTDGPGGSKIVDLHDMQEEERRSITVKIKPDMGCSTDTPLEVHGECANSATGLPDTDETVTFPLDMVTMTDECVPNNNVVAETLRRKDFKEKYEQAITEKQNGNNAKAAQLLEELLDAIEEAKMTKKAKWLEGAEEDTRSLLARLKTSSNADAAMILLDDMCSVYDAVIKQRSGSINENLQSVAYVTTTAKAAIMAAAKSEVSHTVPPSPFTLSVTEAVSQTKTEGGYHSIDVMYTLKAPSTEGDRPPLFLTVVADTSQSMSADAIKTLVDTLKRLIDWLGSKNNVNVLLGIITFGQKAQPLLPLSKLNAIDVTAIKASLDAIQAGGTAKMEDALMAGVDQQAPLVGCRGSQVVFLLSNSKSSSTGDSIGKKLQTKIGSLKYPVSVYTFALKDSDADQLGKIAAAGKGQQYVLPSPKDIPYSFGDAIGGLLGICAKNIKVTINPAETDVEIVSVFPKGEAQGQGGYSASDLNLFEQEKIDFLVSVRFPESSSPASILSISASYVNAFSCGTASSPIASIGTDVKSPKGIDQRCLDRDVAVKLKGAADICMTTPDLEIVKSINQEAYDIVQKTSIKAERYRTSLLVDVSEITTNMDAVKDGSKTRSSACSYLDGLIDLLESERSKGISFKNFFVNEFYDSKIREKSRKEMAQGVVSTNACQEWTSVAAKLRAEIHAWNGHSKAIDLHRSYIQSAESLDGTSMRDGIVKILPMLEEHNAVMGSLAQIDDAIGHDDFFTALNEASAALQDLREFPRDDKKVADVIAYYVLERSRQLIESVESRCNEGDGSVNDTPLTTEIDFMVDEAVKNKEAKPLGADFFAYY